MAGAVTCIKDVDSALTSSSLAEIVFELVFNGLSWLLCSHCSTFGGNRSNLLATIWI